MIPKLPQAYVEHLVAPRHRGDVADAEAAGEVGSMVGGLGVRVTLTYRDAGRGRAVIARAAARSFGSVAPIAPGSVLMGMLLGLEPEAAEKIPTRAVLTALGDGVLGSDGLPPQVVRGAEFVVEAARRALGTPGRGGPSDPCGGGILVCRCLGVGDRSIRCAIRQGAKTPEEVGTSCAAGTGCRSCRPDILRLIDEEREPPAPVPAPDLPPVERIVWAHIAPLLRAHGWRLDAADASGEEEVRLRATPLRARPDVSPLGAAEQARHLLREAVCDAIRVRVEPAPASA